MFNLVSQCLSSLSIFDMAALILSLTSLSVYLIHKVFIPIGTYMRFGQTFCRNDDFFVGLVETW